MKIDIDFIGMAATHNLMCWVCNENKAVYNMYPVWVFEPCYECSKDIGGKVIRKRGWFRNNT